MPSVEPGGWRRALIGKDRRRPNAAKRPGQELGKALRVEHEDSQLRPDLGLTVHAPGRSMRPGSPSASDEVPLPSTPRPGGGERSA